ncbi:uncharacterized protein [Littorina saxatilis]|uniref:UMOD/GP2/OIT3-like D8C domain-containing protein n=1 Tax=Littorina saxatilis TaxID=31220 RepID=A0AAN9ASZ9_9CAEN
MLSLSLIFVLAGAFSCGMVYSFQWETQPDPVVYSCNGKQVTFPWSFKTQSQERVVDIHWIFDSEWGSQMVATMAHDNFLPTAPYGKRVRHVTNGGLLLRDVTTEDSGNLTIEVNVDTDGSFHSHQDSVFLQVGDGLMTQDHTLKASQDPVALWDNSTQRWTIRLTCGHFLFRGQPPVKVAWTNPELGTLPSSGYDNGDFYLTLRTPVAGGNYTCQVPPYLLSDVCVDDNNNSNNNKNAVIASVFVDELKARLSLVEAEQKTPRTPYETSETSCQSCKALEAADEELKKENEQLKEDLDSLKQTHEKDVDILSKSINDSRLMFEQELQSVRQAFRDELQSLWNKTEQHSLSGPCAFGSHTVLDSSQRSVDYGDGSLCDKNLAVGWYRFLLNGADAVIPTTCVAKNHCGTDAPLWLDLQGGVLPAVGTEKAARACAHWSNKCCHWESPVTVRNCGSFVVYRLTPFSHCSLAYCTEPRNN